MCVNLIIRKCLIKNFVKKFNKAEMLEVTYSIPPQLVKGLYSLNATNKIKDFVKREDSTKKTFKGHSYLYFIIADNKVMYVGIDDDATTRLKQHLIKNDAYPNTSSKINKVFEHLQNNNVNKLNYKVIKIKHWYYKELIEHLMIVYFTSKQQAEWNTRE